jgi:NhaP-type Na+/H+ or K+/H+ antiporter
VTTQLHVLYALVGVAALLLAVESRRLRQLPVSEPLVALVVGVLAGPQVLGWLSVPEPVADLALLEGTRLLLAASVMAAALRFRARDLRDVVRAVGVLLAVVMPVAALLTGAAALVLGLPLGLALLVGCCLCPTDPVLAASVVTGEPAERGLPGRLRRMLTVESGANDGLALPLVGIAVAVVLPAETPGGAVPRLLLEVGGGTAVGAALGSLTGWALRLARRRAALEPGPQLVLPLLLALATLGVAKGLGLGGVLAVFVAGLAYDVVLGLEEGDGDDEGRERERVAQSQVDEAINRYAVLPVFVLLGVVLPWQDWAAFGPAALFFAGAVLLLRRPPVVVALARALGLRLRTAAFAGWFGPMGVSALFYLAHSRHEGVTDPRSFAAGTLAVTVSVLAAGLTSSPLRRLYEASDAPRG